MGSGEHRANAGVGASPIAILPTASRRSDEEEAERLSENEERKRSLSGTFDRLIEANLDLLGSVRKLVVATYAGLLVQILVALLLAAVLMSTAAGGTGR